MSAKKRTPRRTPHPAQRAQKLARTAGPSILTPQEHATLDHSVKLAKRRGRMIPVPEHQRLYYRLHVKEDRRLARVNDLEYAIYRLLSDIERSGPTRSDASHLSRAIEALENGLDIASATRKERKRS